METINSMIWLCGLVGVCLVALFVVVIIAGTIAALRDAAEVKAGITTDKPMTPEEAEAELVQARANARARATQPTEQTAAEMLQPAATPPSRTPAQTTLQQVRSSRVAGLIAGGPPRAADRRPSPVFRVTAAAPGAPHGQVFRTRAEAQAFLDQLRVESQAAINEMQGTTALPTLDRHRELDPAAEEARQAVLRCVPTAHCIRYGGHGFAILADSEPDAMVLSYHRDSTLRAWTLAGQYILSNGHGLPDADEYERRRVANERGATFGPRGTTTTPPATRQTPQEVYRDLAALAAVIPAADVSMRRQMEQYLARLRADMAAAAGRLVPPAAMPSLPDTDPVWDVFTRDAQRICRERHPEATCHAVDNEFWITQFKRPETLVIGVGASERKAWECACSFNTTSLSQAQRADLARVHANRRMTAAVARPEPTQPGQVPEDTRQLRRIDLT